MTVALFSLGKARRSPARARRAAAAAGAVSLGLIALTACDEPTPRATVTVGSTSESSEATKGCYNESEGLSKKAFEPCLNKETGKTITLHPGERIRFGVDPEIADSGWIVASTNEVMKGASHDTYRTFDGSAFFEQRDQVGRTTLSQETTIAIVQIGDEGKGPKGMWHFKLKLKP